MFGEAGDDLPEPRLMPVDDWLPAERLGEEFKAVGFYLSGHPLDDYMGALKRKGVITLDEVSCQGRRRAAGRQIGGCCGRVASSQIRARQPVCILPDVGHKRGL